MKIDEIDKLMGAAKFPCVSIIIPTDPADKKTTYELLKRLIQKAKDQQH